MRRIVLGLMLAGLATFHTVAIGAGEDGKEAPRITLMTELSRWLYPDAKMVDGATMADGGHPDFQSVQCSSILATSDPIEKVVDFYKKKLEKTPENSDAKGLKSLMDRKSVASQDDSAGRPVKLRVLVVHGTNTTTTLVISRAEGESQTHIAWTHFIRLGDKK